MSCTNLELITFALRILNVIDEVSGPSPEQTSLAMTVLNDMMANYDADGLRVGWWPQTMSMLTSTCPLQDRDIRDVKILLAEELAMHFGIELTPTLVSEAEYSYKCIAKRSIEYFESDLTGLPFSQGGLFGPGRV